MEYKGFGINRHPARSESKYDINNTTGNRRCLSAEVEVKLNIAVKVRNTLKLIPKDIAT